MEKIRLNKVAEITAAFWVMKILATTLGETLGDLLSMTFDWGYGPSLILTMAIFIIILIGQLAAKKHYSYLFWLVIIGTTTVGTEVSDFMDRSLGLGYFWGSSILLTGLISVLFIWYKSAKKIIVYPVTDLKIEAFYWIAILFSNSLGTAFGDYLSDDLGFSYIGGAAVTLGIICIVVLLHYFSKLNQILLFWIAFVFTRPFGATFGDLLTKPIEKGGLDLGTIPATLVSCLLLFGVLFISNRKKAKAAIT